jgi:hypothetical protein
MNIFEAKDAVLTMSEEQDLYNEFYHRWRNNDDHEKLHEKFILHEKARDYLNDSGNIRLFAKLRNPKDNEWNPWTDYSKNIIADMFKENTGLDAPMPTKWDYDIVQPN